MINWDDMLEIDKGDVNLSFNNFFDQTNSLLDKYVPLKKISQKEYKRKFKPWITNGILTSIKRRDHIFGKFIKAKSPDHNLHYQMNTKN